MGGAKLPPPPAMVSRAPGATRTLETGGPGTDGLETDDRAPGATRTPETDSGFSYIAPRQTFPDVRHVWRLQGEDLHELCKETSVGFDIEAVRCLINDAN